MSSKIGFIVAGAQKCGTSLLRKYLQQHPDICISQKMEPHFFDEDAFFQTGAIDYAAYEAQYSHCDPDGLKGDVTPAYLFWRDAPARVHAYNPHMKILVMLRNPTDRAFSHWNMMRQKNLEPLAFHDALVAEAGRAEACLPAQDKMFSYVARGRYAEQLQRWFSCFPRGQFLVLRMEELAVNHHLAMDRVFEFLNVRSDVSIQPKFANVRPYEVELCAEDREYLQAQFQHETALLMQLLMRDFSDWSV